MANISRVVSTEKPDAVRRSGTLFSLRLKLFTALVLALAAPFGLLLLESEQLGGGEYILLGACAVLLGIGIGFFAADELIIEPTKKLLRWLTEARGKGPEQVSFFPDLAPDEIGAIAREVSAINARMLQNTERSRNTADERSIFLTIAAHQLRTPITGLTWSIEEILDPLTPEEKKRELIQNLSGSLKRTLLVVNHILASANVEEGRFGYVMEMIDLVPIIQTLLEEFKPLADSKQQELRFEHGEIPKVYADPDRISLAIFDLVSNAVDYTAVGGHVTVELKAQADRVDVSVADNGIGIPEKELPFLFTKFNRGENARHVRPNGSGLGLYLVKNIVASHGSDITVESNETLGGTKFSFHLPTHAPAK